LPAENGIGTLQKVVKFRAEINSRWVHISSDPNIETVLLEALEKREQLLV